MATPSLFQEAQDQAVAKTLRDGLPLDGLRSLFEQVITLREPSETVDQAIHALWNGWGPPPLHGATLNEWERDPRRYTQSTDLAVELLQEAIPDAGFILKRGDDTWTARVPMLSRTMEAPTAPCAALAAVLEAVISMKTMERVDEAADQYVAQDPSLVPDDEMDYEDWLEWTGLDDSFVGNGETIPGTGDLYEAVLRAIEARDRAATEEPAPPAPGLAP